MELEVVDIGIWLSRSTQGAGDPAVERLCRQVSDTLRETGVLVVRDPRVSYADNAAFLDMMELYFSQSHEAKMKDVRAELHYQVRASASFASASRRSLSSPLWPGGRDAGAGRSASLQGETPRLPPRLPPRPTPRHRWIPAARRTSRCSPRSTEPPCPRVQTPSACTARPRCCLLSSFAGGGTCGASGHAPPPQPRPSWS